jgi:adenosylmethionine-8-amino-7-oxononanoate aminotransferase
MNHSNNLQERDLQSVWHPFTQMKLESNAIPIVKGEGVYLYDENGKQYIDGISSWWVNTHGHAHPYIAQKVFEQLNTLEHVIFAGFTHEPAVRLAERLLKLLPATNSKIFYSDNGSTAVEVALKMAFQYWYNQGIEKYDVVAFKNSYHGDTFGAMSVSQRSAYTNPFSPNLFDVNFIETPVAGEEANALQQLQEIIQHKKVAAFIFEPLVQGAEGMVMYEPEALDSLIALCKENNILCIADEVMTGFARTGRMFASDYLINKPDIISMSKGITGGTMALGATSCTEAIYQMFWSDDKLKTFFHGHSYTANPVACAAALASLDLFQQDATCNGIVLIRKMHETFLQKLNTYKNVGNARSRGTILAFEFLTTEDKSYFHSERDTIYEFFLEKGILLRPLGNTIYIMPPYCINETELNSIYEAIEAFLLTNQ